MNVTVVLCLLVHLAKYMESPESPESIETLLLME
jgi:hypothetical protein